MLAKLPSLEKRLKTLFTFSLSIFKQTVHFYRTSFYRYLILSINLRFNVNVQTSHIILFCLRAPEKDKLQATVFLKNFRHSSESLTSIGLFPCTQISRAAAQRSARGANNHSNVVSMWVFPCTGISQLYIKCFLISL